MASPPENPSLRRSDDFYRALFEVNSAVKLLICPTTGQIVDANQAAAELYGWSLDQLRSMRITDINTLTASEVAAEMENARTLRRRYFNFRHRTAHGDTRHVEVHSGPVRIDGEELLLSIVHDVTERDELEEQLQRAHRLDSIGRLAGGVAHDFNNLLTVMLTTVDFMRRKVPEESPLLPHLADLRHAATRAAELTNSLLSFGRRQMLQPTVLHLGELVDEIGQLLERTTSPSLRVVVEHDHDAPLVYADPSRIEQVVMNLALNARDAMSENGTLTLRIRRASSAAVAESGAEWVALDVEDTGTGMPPEVQARVFEPFFTTKELGSGTGLGLATAYGIVRQSGGHIEVASEVGRGTTFTVSLPRASTPRARANERAASPLLAVHGARVLLVEDVDSVRDVLAQALAAAGYHVDTAASAEAALALPVETIAQLDAVVSDIVLGGRSGVELVASLLERRPGLPALLMSGHARGHDVAALPTAVAFLAKPFDGDDLVRAVGRVIRR